MALSLMCFIATDERKFATHLGCVPYCPVVLCREKETARLQQVMHHPVFKSNPIQAITNHLKASLPPPPAPAPAVAKGKGGAKKQRRKGSSGGMMVD